MVTKDLITLLVKSEGVDKVTVDFDKIAKGVKEIELESKDAKKAVEIFKENVKELQGALDATEKEIKEQKKEVANLEKEYEKAAKAAAEFRENSHEKMATSQGYKKANEELSRLDSVASEAGNKLQNAKEKLKESEVAAAGFSKEIAKNNENVKQAGYYQEYLRRTTALTDMTTKQLGDHIGFLRGKLANISKSLNPEEWKKYNNQLVAAEKQLEKVAIGGDQVKSRFDSIGNTIKKVLPLMVAYGALRFFQNILSGAIEWIKKAPEVAAKAEGVSRAFDKINNPNLLSTLRKETKGLINDLTLMQSAVRAEKFGIPVNDLGKYLKFAQQRAQETGQSVEYLAESIVNGIGRKSKLIIDNLGISAAQLNDEIKKGATFAQAVTKVVDQELAKQGTLSLTSADKATQAAVKWENAQLKVGNSLKWLSDKWNEFSGSVADGVADMAGDSRTASQAFDDQAKKVAQLEVNTVRLMPRYEELKGKTRLTKDEHKELDGILQQVARTMPIAVTEWDKYGNAVSISTEKVHSFIRAEQIRLKLMYEDKIKERKENLVEYVREFENLQKDIDKLNKGETLYKSQTIFQGSNTGATTSYLQELSDEEIISLRKRYAEVKALVLETNEEIDYMNGSSYKKEIGIQVKTEEKRNEFYAMEKKALKQWIDDRRNANNEYLKLAQEIYSSRFGGGYGDGKEEKESKIIARQKKELEIILENLEATHRKRLADIRQKYITGDIKSESEYNQKIFLQEQAYHLLREQALEEFLKKTTIKELKSDISKQIADQQDKRLDQQVKYQAKLEKIILDANPEEKEKKEYEDRLRDLEIYGKSRQELQMLLMSAETEEEKSTLKKKLEALELLEQQHQDNLLKIRNGARAKEKSKGEEEFQEKFGKDKAGKQKAIEDETNQFSLDKEIGAYTPTEAFDAEVELQKKRLSLIQEELEARKAAGLDISMILKKQASEEANLTKIYTSEFNRRKQEYSQYGNAIGTVLGNVISGQEDALKGFADVMLDILFDTLTQMINAEIIKVVATGTGAIARSTAEAMAAPDSVLSFGATGFARIAILTAVISGAMMAAKSSLKGLLGGGKSDSSSSTSTSNRTRVTTGFETGGKIDVVRSQDGRKYSAVYDPDRRGFIDEPTVLVGDGPVGKRKEWVASNPLYENPTARPIIDLLDEAQRSGRVSTIDMNQLMRARMAGFESGGFPSRPSSSLSQPIVNNNAANTRYNTRELLLLNDTLGRVGQILDRVEVNGLGVNYQALKETTVKMTEIESYGKKQ